MDRETLEAVVRWQNRLGDTEGLEITFHGGEPLVPGIQFYRMECRLMRDGGLCDSVGGQSDCDDLRKGESKDFWATTGPHLRENEG